MGRKFTIIIEEVDGGADLEVSLNINPILRQGEPETLGTTVTNGVMNWIQKLSEHIRNQEKAVQDVTTH